MGITAEAKSSKWNKLLTEEQIEAVIKYAKGKNGSSEFYNKKTGATLCGGFVHECYFKGAGIRLGAADANKLRDLPKKDGEMHTDPNEPIPVGAILYWSWVRATGTNYGHVALYLGNNEIIHVWGKVQITKRSVVDSSRAHGGYIYEGWSAPKGYTFCDHEYDSAGFCVKCGAEFDWKSTAQAVNMEVRLNNGELWLMSKPYYAKDYVDENGTSRGNINVKDSAGNNIYYSGTTTLKTTKRYKNAHTDETGIYWYRVTHSSGAVGYVACSRDYASREAGKPYVIKQPGTISFDEIKPNVKNVITAGGKKVSGTVVSSAYPLSNVTIGIYKNDGTAVYSKSWTPNKTKQDLSGADKMLLFSKLKPGDYVYKITAITDSGPATGEAETDARIAAANRKEWVRPFSVVKSGAKNYYSVTLYSNDGTGALTQAHVKKGKSLDLSKYIPDRPGYRLVGWAAEQSAGTPQYTTSIKPKGHIKLYALWQLQSDNVFVFMPNGGSGTMPSLSIDNDQAFTLPRNTFTRTGYRFTGWTVQRNADSNYLIWKDKDDWLQWLADLANVPYKEWGWSTDTEYPRVTLPDEYSSVMDSRFVYTGTTSLPYITYTFYAQWEKIVVGDIPINATNFPDAAFRNYVSENFDSDGNGKLSQAEINSATWIDVEDMGITTLKGVELLTAVGYLHCEKNQLTSLDITKNTALWNLGCNENRLTSLNVSQNTALESLSCSNNLLTALDVTHNTKLDHLWCDGNQLTALDVSKCPGLQYLCCHDNSIQRLDVRSNPNLLRTYTEGSIYYSEDNSIWYKIYHDPPYTSFVKYLLQVDPSTELITGVVIDSVAINATNFPNAAFRTYVSEHFDKDNNGSLNQAEIRDAESIDVSDEGITTLKGVEKLVFLKELFCGGNQLSSLDVSKNTILQELSCWNNQLTALDVSKNTLLQSLDCSGNGISSLDVTKNIKLYSLDCSGNQLTALDLTHNTKLDYLECHNNQLTTLDIRNQPRLVEAYNEGYPEDWDGVYSYEMCLIVDATVTIIAGSRQTPTELEPEAPAEPEPGTAEPEPETPAEPEPETPTEPEPETPTEPEPETPAEPEPEAPAETEPEVPAEPEPETPTEPEPETPTEPEPETPAEPEPETPAEPEPETPAEPEPEETQEPDVEAGSEDRPFTEE